MTTPSITPARFSEGVEAAAKALLDKLDAAKPHIVGATAIAAMHHCPYQGPTIHEEIAALRAALASQGAG